MAFKDLEEKPILLETTLTTPSCCDSHKFKFIYFLKGKVNNKKFEKTITETSSLLFPNEECGEKFNKLMNSNHKLLSHPYPTSEVQITKIVPSISSNKNIDFNSLVLKEKANNEKFKKTNGLKNSNRELLSHLYSTSEVPSISRNKNSHSNSLIAQEEAKVRLDEIRKQIENKVPLEMLSITLNPILPSIAPEPFIIEYSCEFCLKSVKENEMVTAKCFGKCKSSFHFACWCNVIYEDIARCPKKFCSFYIEFCQYRNVTTQMKLPPTVEQIVEELDYELLNKIVHEEESIESFTKNTIPIQKEYNDITPKDTSVLWTESTPLLVEDISKFDSCSIGDVQSTQKRKLMKIGRSDT